MTDEVGFGKVIPLHQRLTGDIGEVFRILKEAEAVVGDEVLSPFEESFTLNCLAQIKQHGMKWDYSEKREVVVEAIKKKLTKEGLI